MRCGKRLAILATNAVSTVQDFSEFSLCDFIAAFILRDSCERNGILQGEADRTTGRIDWTLIHFGRHSTGGSAVGLAGVAQAGEAEWLEFALHPAHRGPSARWHRQLSHDHRRQTRRSGVLPSLSASTWTRAGTSSEVSGVTIHHPFWANGNWRSHRSRWRPVR